MKKAAFSPHNIKKNKLKALHSDIIVHEMAFDGRTLTSGIILPGDDGTGYGIRPRWGQVYAVGPKQTDIQVGQWIMVAHGRWTRGIKVQDETGEHTLRKIDPKDILLISNSVERPQDDTQSTAVHVDKKSAD